MSILDKFSKGQADRRHRQIEDNSMFLFQITEHCGELWLTFDCRLVCPCSMLKDSPVDAIKKMRELYIKEHESE